MPSTLVQQGLRLLPRRFGAWDSADHTSFSKRADNCAGPVAIGRFRSAEQECEDRRCHVLRQQSSGSEPQGVHHRSIMTSDCSAVLIRQSPILLNRDDQLSWIPKLAAFQLADCLGYKALSDQASGTGFGTGFWTAHRVAEWFRSPRRSSTAASLSAANAAGRVPGLQRRVSSSTPGVREARQPPGIRRRFPQMTSGSSSGLRRGGGDPGDRQPPGLAPGRQP